jgi:hypothetical protein
MMRCDEARTSMILGASGDCAAPRLAAAEKHAASCTECARFRTELRPLPLREVRAELPLTEGDLAVIRAGVMRTIRTGASTTPWLRAFAPITAALLIAAISGLALFVTLHRSAGSSRAVRPALDSGRVGTLPGSQPARSHTAPQAAVAEQRAGLPEAVGPVAGTLQPAAPRAASARRPAPREPRRAASHPRQIAHAQVAALEPAPAPLRIELQTSNPNIRIIWIIGQSGTAGDSVENLRTN